MDFLIRDDDICFFTSPEELKNSWEWYLTDHFSKLNLAVIPYVNPSEFGRPGDSICPIGENAKLTGYLKQGIKKKKIEILLHGYSHASCDGRFEFESRDRKELSEKIRAGKDYLEDLFHIKICAFVPPHNALSKEGLEAVRENGLNILSSVPSSPFRIGLDSQRLSFFVKRKFFSFRYRKCLKGKFVYPFLIRFTTLTNLDCLSLIPTKFRVDDLLNFYRIVKKRRGIYCLATHYWEIEDNNKKTIHEFIKNISKDPEVRFVLASDIF
jgi:hypothetical protein